MWREEFQVDKRSVSDAKEARFLIFCTFKSRIFRKNNPGVYEKIAQMAGKRRGNGNCWIYFFKNRLLLMEDLLVKLFHIIMI